MRSFGGNNGLSEHYIVVFSAMTLCSPARWLPMFRRKLAPLYSTLKMKGIWSSETYKIIWRHKPQILKVLRITQVHWSRRIRARSLLNICHFQYCTIFLNVWSTALNSRQLCSVELRPHANNTTEHTVQFLFQNIWARIFCGATKYLTCQLRIKSTNMLQISRNK